MENNGGKTEVVNEQLKYSIDSLESEGQDEICYIRGGGDRRLRSEDKTAEMLVSELQDIPRQLAGWFT